MVLLLLKKWLIKFTWRYSRRKANIETSSNTPAVSLLEKIQVGFRNLIQVGFRHLIEVGFRDQFCLQAN